MANQCHSDQHGHHQGVFCLLLAIFILCGVAGCSAYTIRHHKEPNEATSASYVDPAADQVDIDRFYFPTDEGLREFQQILLRELGLSRVPDLSKVIKYISIPIYCPLCNRVERTRFGIVRKRLRPGH